MADLADNVLNKLAEIERQEGYREESWHVRELRPVAGTTIDDVNLEALNDYVQQLNRPVRVETIKPDLEAARGFLERKRFLQDGVVTTLGMGDTGLLAASAGHIPTLAPGRSPERSADQEIKPVARRPG